MQPRPRKPASALERRLLKAFAGLTPEQQATVADFAEFLAARGAGEEADAEPAPPAEPVPIPRPEKESVVAAIKRLTATYPMLERSAMLNETSSLMTQHVVQGRPAREVIDDLEALFRRHYDALRGDLPAP